MNTITHILNKLNVLSQSHFKFTKYLESLKLINYIPSSVSDQLLSEEFIYHLNKGLSYLDWLIEFFDVNINPALKKEYLRLKKAKSDAIIPYADFKMDKPPVFKEKPPDQLSFEDIFKEGRSIQPVQRRSSKPFTFEGVCPFCGAPHEYIYDNNGRGQYKCKVCHGTFKLKVSPSGKTGVYCPHCGRKLDMKHDRKGYLVFVCANKKCSYYLKNKKLMDEGEDEQLRTSSNQYRLHYHYREFKFNLENLKKAEQNITTPVNLSKIHYDTKVLGLALTYYVNYGLSSRKTALIL